MERTFSTIGQSLACFVVFLALLTQVMACMPLSRLKDDSKPTICFVLPDGYVGAFQLVLDEKGNEEVVKKNGRYVYEIPPNGLLKVKTFHPFEGWHRTVAVYKNGSSIPTEDSTLPPDTVALRVLGTSQHNDGPFTQTNVIGTQEQAKQAQKDEMAGTLKLGKS
jgi:hypothetical protein